MADQLGLDLDEQPAPNPPRRRRSYHVRSHQTVDEVVAGEHKASLQDARILDVFRRAPGQRFTPSAVQDELIEMEPPPVPLLTSVRRSITTLCTRGFLIHFKADRRPGPFGSKQSTWGLNPSGGEQ